MIRLCRRTGATLTEILVVMAIIGILIAILVPAVQRIRHAAAQAECLNNMKQIALALQGYHDTHKQFPPALSLNTSDSWYLSWMGRILPFVDNDPLANDIKNEYTRVSSPWGNFWLPAWGGQPPHAGLSETPVIFRCPSEGRVMTTNLMLGTGNSADAGFTSYIGVHGSESGADDGVLVVNARVTLSGITDGSSNTLMVGERPPYRDMGYGMWYAGAGYDGNGTGDVVLGARNVIFAGKLTCPATRVGLQAGSVNDACSQSHFWSHHTGGSNFAFADGTVRFLTFGADAKLQALATRSAGDDAALE